MADLISRQWLMRSVNDGFIKFDLERDENRFIHLVRDIAPSAELKGHWNPDLLRPDGSMLMSCSECNGIILYQGSSQWNYCPNCGARMEVDK